MDTGNFAVNEAGAAGITRCNTHFLVTKAFLAKLARLAACNVALVGLAVGTVGRSALVAIVAGTVWNLSGVGLPKLADTTISLLSQAGVPTALFVLGLSLSRFGLKGNRAAVAVLLVIKLLVMPVAAWWLATVVFERRG